MGLGRLLVRLVHPLKVVQAFLIRSVDILLFKSMCVFLLSIVDVYLGKWGFLWECGNQKSALSAQNLECPPDNITQLSTYWAIGVLSSPSPSSSGTWSNTIVIINYDESPSHNIKHKCLHIGLHLQSFKRISKEPQFCFSQIPRHICTFGVSETGDRWVMTSSRPKLGLIESQVQLRFFGFKTFSNWLSQSYLTLDYKRVHRYSPNEHIYSRDLSSLVKHLFEFVFVWC